MAHVLSADHIFSSSVQPCFNWGMGWGLCLISIWSFNPLAFGVVPTFSAVLVSCISEILFYFSAANTCDFCGGGRAVTQHDGVGKRVLASSQNPSSFSTFLCQPPLPLLFPSQSHLVLPAPKSFEDSEYKMGQFLVSPSVCLIV